MPVHFYQFLRIDQSRQNKQTQNETLGHLLIYNII